jgi:hypothetical protein
MFGPSDNPTAIRDIQTEINKLAEQQIEALKKSRFGGMTLDEGKEYDTRRRRMIELNHQLTALKEGHSPTPTDET